MKMGEHELQKSCIRWFRYTYPKHQKLLFAVPNGGTRFTREAARLKAEGVTAGVSDLILMVPNKEYAGMVIEMKHGNNKLSKHQKEWLKLVAEMGYKAIVCYSFDTFVTHVIAHMNTANVPKN